MQHVLVNVHMCIHVYTSMYIMTCRVIIHIIQALFTTICRLGKQIEQCLPFYPFQLYRTGGVSSNSISDRWQFYRSWSSMGSSVARRVLGLAKNPNFAWLMKFWHCMYMRWKIYDKIPIFVCFSSCPVYIIASLPADSFACNTQWLTCTYIHV